MADKSYFCIRGHMKSGTNWVCQLLNLHPDIHSRGEYHWHRYFETYQKNNEIFHNLAEGEKSDPIIRKQLNQFVKSCMTQYADPHAKFIGDRTPHTLYPIVLPRVPHISVVRDCRDVLVSKVFHHFNMPHISTLFQKSEMMRELHQEFKNDPWFFQKNPDQLLCNESFIRYTCSTWVSFMRCDRNTADKQPSLPLLFVRYEDLHEQIDEIREKMYRFIGADPELAASIPRYLRPGHNSENPDKFNRKGQVGDWQNYMTSQAKQWINEEAGSELIKQGYVQDLDWTCPRLQLRKSA
ncbi:sulfotransferase domain-containing protein [bacterium]|nr:sulfotransferase domain-containing protein [bacterium]